MRALKKLRIDQTDPVTWDELSQMPSLEDFTVIEASNAVLSGMPNLRRLHLSKNAGINVVHQLHYLPKLKELSISEVPMTDAAIAKFGNLHELNKLDIWFQRRHQKEEFTGDGFSSWSQCRHLKSIHLENFTPNRRSAEEISKILSIKELNCGTPEDADIDAVCSAFAKLPNLENLPIYIPRETMAGHLNSIVIFKLNKTLSFTRSEITDSDLAYLTRCKNLEELDLSKTKITDAGLNTLSKLQTLRKLDLSDTLITGSGLAQVASLPNLQDLNLENDKLSDDSIGTQKWTSPLDIIDMRRTSISGPALRNLVDIPTLTTLHLAYTPLSDSAIRNLDGAAVQNLNISSTEITEHGLETLSHCKSLKKIVATGCGILTDKIAPELAVTLKRSGPLEYNYDSPVDSQLHRRLDRAFIRLRGVADSEVDLQEEAEALCARGKFQDAIAKYDKALFDIENPKYSVCSAMSTGRNHRIFECLIGKGYAEIEENNCESAIKDLNQAIAIARLSAIARKFRGYAHFKLGHFDEALQDLNRAIEINPGIASAYQYRSMIYEALGKANERDADKRKAASLGYQPEFVSVMNNMPDTNKQH